MKPLPWTAGRPPPDSLTLRAMRFATSTSSRVEVDVPGDEERPRADRHGADARVGPCRPEVRTAISRGVADLVADRLVAAAAHVGEPDAVGSRRRARVQVDREVEPVRDPGTEPACQLDAVLERRRAQRDEGDHVHRADAWVLALVAVHLDDVDRHLDRGFQRGLDQFGLAGKGQHRAVVGGVARAVEDERAVDAGGRPREAVDDVEPAAFGIVRDRLDQHAWIVPQRHPRVSPRRLG